MPKYSAFGFILVAGLMAGFLSLGFVPVNGTGSPTVTPLASVQAYPTPSYPSPGVPVHIAIPGIGVDAPVETVGKDGQGRMAVPTKWTDTGWYGEGIRPGEIGNAVIDGHVNTPTLNDSVFARLRELKPGNAVIVSDAAGRAWSFTVLAVVEVHTENFPIIGVFGSSPYRQLNLITCSGTYDRTVKDYTGRIVVYTRLENVRR